MVTWGIHFCGGFINILFQTGHQLAVRVALASMNKALDDLGIELEALREAPVPAAADKLQHAE